VSAVHRVHSLLNLDEGIAGTVDFFYSPGFGGACALLAAVIAFIAAGLSTRQRRRADEAALAEAARLREEVRRSEEIQRCWDRYVWVVDHANEIGVRLTAGLLSRITDTAAALGDRDLVEFSRQFTVELFAATTGELLSTEPPTNGDNESGSEVSRS
jgi:hypothetical protein